MDPRIELTDEWKAHLPPLETEEDKEIQEALETLARVVQILDIPDTSFLSYSTAVTRLTEQHLTLSRSLVRLRQIEDELKDYTSSLLHEYTLVAHWKKMLTPGSSENSFLERSSALERRRDAMLKKAKEYHRDLEELMREEPLETPITIHDLISQKEKNLALERDIKEKRTKLQAFRGLPPNIDLARHELRVARQRQTELIQLRERLLRKMAESVE